MWKFFCEYFENYFIEGIKVFRSVVYCKLWIVYLDRVENVVYVNLGGRVKFVEVGLLDMFLVIKIKGDYLWLIKYNFINIKYNCMI